MIHAAGMTRDGWMIRKTAEEFADVLAEAQRLGYAESDPSFDVDGIDAAHKLAILAALAFNRPVDFAAVHIEGIRAVSALDIAFATELGFGTIRWQGFYDAVIAEAAGRPTTRIDPQVLDVLRLGAHQLLGMRVATHAAADQTVGLAKVVAGPARAASSTP